MKNKNNLIYFLGNFFGGIVRNIFSQVEQKVEKYLKIINWTKSRLKNEKAKLLDSLNRIISEKEELKKTVKVAQVLKADNFHVSVLKKSGKEKDDDAMAYKAKNIDKVKVTFQVMENKVAVAETKSFYLKVIGPDGAVIYNESTGGGELDEDGSKTNYTSKQDLLYDGKKQNVTFLYHNQGTWQKGLHRVEVVCENKNIGSGTFVVK